MLKKGALLFAETRTSFQLGVTFPLVTITNLMSTETVSGCFPLAEPPEDFLLFPEELATENDFGTTTSDG